MYDKNTVGFFKQRFGGVLGRNDWESLQEQVFCEFLLRHKKDVLETHGRFLDGFVEQMDVNELRTAREHIGGKEGKGSMVIGDELGFIYQAYPECSFAFYSRESMDHATKLGVKEASLLEETTWTGVEFKKVIVLQLMSQLMARSMVQGLGAFLRQVFSCLGKDGELLVVDRVAYQDDFLSHFVSLGAEIKSIHSYGPLDFLLRILP
jgi:hypothetical protein